MALAAARLVDVPGLDMDQLQERARGIVARIDEVMGDDARWGELAALVGELEVVIAASVMTDSRWGDLKRHLHFRETQDWEDIVRADWPSVRRWLAPS